MGRSVAESQLVFVILLLAVIAFATLARRVQQPYPIVLVLAGLLVSLIPGLPKVMLDPDIIFFVVLPPLLYAAAWTTSWRDFSYNLVSISSLAIGLVGFTVAGVALAAPFLLPAFDWRTGFVLGAVVCTTDAIAATTIARRTGLPRRIVHVVEGESLVNDATGLLALELGVSLIASGAALSAGHAFFRFAQLVVGGLAVGFLVGGAVHWVEKRIDDGPIEIAIGILVPYAAYLLAGGLRASGVLAVVTAGLYLSRKSSQMFSPRVRIQTYAVWDAFTFVLNGLVFLLIGLQLPYVLASIRGYAPRALLFSAAIFSAFLIALRLLWVFPGARLSYFIRRRFLHQNEKVPPATWLVITGWTGMRGVIALAAAMSLPQALPDGAPFPQRNLIVLLTFCAILATLVLQGLTLAPLIRLLGLAGSPGPSREEQQARRAAIESALDHLERTRGDRPGLAPFYDDLALHYRQRLAELTGASSSQDGRSNEADNLRRYRDLSLELVQVEREAAIRIRDEGGIDDDALRAIERELDLTEARLRGATLGAD
ncbi:MAG: Na+/H+ antiporter [Myxococcales bacterium]